MRRQIDTAIISAYFWLKQNLANLEECFSGRAGFASVASALPEFMRSRPFARRQNASGGGDDPKGGFKKK
jgi:hypothetical protein